MTPEQEELRKSILGTVSDAVSNLMYYNRKEDDDLPVGAIEQAVEDGVITYDEMAAKFRKELG